MFYAFETVAMIGAALVDGFLPEIATIWLHSLSNVADDGLAILRLCSIAIQILPKMSVMAISASVLFWSANLIRTAFYGGL